MAPTTLAPWASPLEMYKITDFPRHNGYLVKFIGGIFLHFNLDFHRFKPCFSHFKTARNSPKPAPIFASCRRWMAATDGGFHSNLNEKRKKEPDRLRQGGGGQRGRPLGRRRLAGTLQRGRQKRANDKEEHWRVTNATNEEDNGTLPGGKTPAGRAAFDYPRRRTREGVKGSYRTRKRK